MCSTRKGQTGSSFRRAAAVLGLIGFALVGCQRTVPPPLTSPVNSSPLVVDEAMQHRQFERSTSYYASGATVAGGTGYLWQTHETIPPRYQRLTDAPVAVANIVSMPVGIFVESPWQKQVYRGE